MSEDRVGKAKTVAELITFLQTIDAAAVPISLEPPFTGVKVIVQSNGKVLIGPDRDEYKPFEKATPTGQS